MQVKAVVRELGRASFKRKASGESVGVDTVVLEVSVPMELITVQFSEAQTKAGLAQAYQAAVGKSCLVPLALLTFRGASGEFSRWSLAGEGLPQVLEVRAAVTPAPTARAG